MIRSRGSLAIIALAVHTEVGYDSFTSVLNHWDQPDDVKPSQTHGVAKSEFRRKKLVWSFLPMASQVKRSS